MRVISAQPGVLDSIEKMCAWFRKQHNAPHREIHGLLPSIPGVKCEKCKLVFSASDQAKTHDRKKHAVIIPATDTTEESWSYEPMLVSVRVQQPFYVVGRLKSYMEVVAIEPALPQLQPQPESDAILAARNVYEQAGSVLCHLQNDSAQQTVNTPPWMSMLGWDVVIRDSRFADSYAAIHNAEPSSSWRAALTSVVKLSFDAVQRDITAANCTYLQVLGTSGELQSDQFSRYTWWRIISDGCEYMDTLVCFLSAVLVAATDTEGAVALRGLLRLADDQIAVAAGLQRLLVQDSAKICSCTALEPAVSDSFWSLMYALFGYKWSAYSPDANWTYHPVIVFLCLHGWRGTNLHKPRRLRPFTLHLIYWVRAAVHTNIQRNIAAAKTAWERDNRTNGLVRSSQPRVVYRMVDIRDADSASDVVDFGSRGAFDDGPIIQKWHLLVRDSMSTPCGALFHTAQILKSAEDSCRTSNIVDWVAESHYTSMHYGGQLISIRDIGDAYYGAVADIMAAMAPELAHFTEAQLAKLSMCKDIAENCTNDTMGYSFLTDERSNYAALYGSHLADAKFDNGDFTYEAAAGAVELDRTAMREWLGRMDALLDTITFAIHISGGQPARAPELASIMLRNDQISRRSAYAKRDTLCVATTYHRGLSQHEIAHYLPKELAQLILQYLVLIRPCIRQVAIILLANDAAEQRAIAHVYDNYLFACNGQPMTTMHLHQSFARH
ncbi:hypothetical protein GGF42_004506 [Coemansia sp. RSA 2424]|nr:hypothetical protein GGF42_004506 [Coemansia sp. RSA 2424]